MARHTGSVTITDTVDLDWLTAPGDIALDLADYRTWASEALERELQAEAKALTKAVSRGADPILTVVAMVIVQEALPTAPRWN